MQLGTESTNRAHTAFDVIAVAASFGGIETFVGIISRLPTSFPVPIVYLQHLGDNFPASFPNSLARRVNLPVKWATQGAPMQCGIHVAPPGAHLSVDAQKLFVLSRTPKVQFVRPSANILFSSLAVVFRSRFLAVVLTGFGSDAAMGVTLAKSMGGYVIVQDQETSAAVEMPAAAIRTGCADLILPRDNIAHALITLTMMPGAAELFTGVNAYPDSLKN